MLVVVVVGLPVPSYRQITPRGCLMGNDGGGAGRDRPGAPRARRWDRTGAARPIWMARGGRFTLQLSRCPCHLTEVHFLLRVCVQEYVQRNVEWSNGGRRVFAVSVGGNRASRCRCRCKYAP